MSTLHRVPLRTQVADLIRAEIQAKHKPGDRLQTELEMTQRHKVSLITIKEALGLLSHQGWIERRQGRGTFVTKPPSESVSSLARLALVSDLELERFQSSTFFLNVLTGVKRNLTERHLGSRLYLGLHNQHVGDRTPGSTLDFLDDIEGKMVAGVVASGLSPHRGILAALAERKIPIVSTMADFPNAVIPDGESLIAEGVRELLRRGRRRIGVPIGPGVDSRLFEAARAAVAAEGLPESTLVSVLCDVSMWSFAGSREATMRLLVNNPRPDSILLFDDFQFQGALAALSALGVRTPDDVLICTIHNAGSDEPAIPCVLMEVDTDAIARELCAQLERLMAGSTEERKILIPGHIRAIGDKPLSSSVERSPLEVVRT